MQRKKYVIKEIAGDTLTPIAILQKISGEKKFLLESSNKHNDSGRFSFIGTEPVMEVIAFGDEIEVLKKNKGKVTLKGNPIEYLKKLLPKVELNENDKIKSPFVSGAVGYIGYDIIRQFENIGKNQFDEMQMPDIHLMIYEEIIIFDHLDETIQIIGTPILEGTDTTTLEERIDILIDEMTKTVSYEEIEQFSFTIFKSNLTKDEFIKSVSIAKEHIVAGDIFQVVISQRMKSKYSGNSLSLYRKHRKQNPTPYMFYIDFNTYTVIGSSPESLVKTVDKTIITNPIAGTKKRGKTLKHDLEIETQLKNDEKELAEHKMLVDLSRNDIGRISNFGTVKVTKFMEVEKFRHVMHLVSEVTGELAGDSEPLDALSVCIPAGTVSGAPKIKAMEIINKLEKSRRGLYSGAVGYLSTNGNLDFALAIRTIVLKDRQAYIQAGAGIVYDSDPESEYEETINKLKSFLEDYNDFTN
ncbi:MAG: anthranilate synthase subunit [Bacillales bacterium]|jgi:anthranilate synthase component 1|nr:anthranilate synthase subunit [Bacillales bacterium]